MVPGHPHAAQSKQPWRLLAASAALLIFSGVYATWALREFRAARLAERSDQTSLQKAVALEPGNAEYVARLGRYQLLLAQSPQSAATGFRRSLALNPYSAQVQLDLAAALAQSGDVAGQQRAIEAALAAEPTNPHVAWIAGNWSLLRGDDSAALRQFRVVVENDPEMAQPAIALAWRRVHDAQQIFDVCIPPTPNARLAFLEFLMREQQPEAAAFVWQQTTAAGEPLELRVPLDYISWLMWRREWAEASADWRQLQQLDSELRGYNEPANLVTNAGFEQPMLNAAWDWRTAPPPGVALSTDSMSLHSGARSLVFEFHDAGAAAPGISQFIAVEPGTHYSFRAFWKADDLVSASPPRWVARDPADGRVLLTSEPIIGATGWREVRGEFTTGANTAAIELLLLRPADGVIRGRLAIDDVSITREPQP